MLHEVLAREIRLTESEKTFVEERYGIDSDQTSCLHSVIANELKIVALVDHGKMHFAHVLQMLAKETVRENSFTHTAWLTCIKSGGQNEKTHPNLF